VFGLQSAPQSQSSRLRALQQKVAPRFDTDGISTTHYISELCSGGLEDNDAFQKYVDIVLENPQVERLAKRYRLSTARFAKLYRLMCTAGLNRWQQDRNLALEALADYDALLFVIGCKRHRVGDDVITEGLEAYMTGQIKKHQLAQLVRSNSS